jgi:hypothetical protein
MKERISTFRINKKTVKKKNLGEMKKKMADHILCEVVALQERQYS